MAAPHPARVQAETHSGQAATLSSVPATGIVSPLSCPHNGLFEGREIVNRDTGGTILGRINSLL
jgi:hypothetical protein